MCDTELMAVAIRPRFGRNPTSSEVQDALRRLNTMPDDRLLSARSGGGKLLEVLYAA